MARSPQTGARTGCYSDTVTRPQQALALHRQSGDGIGESVVQQNLGILHYHQGRWSEARQHLTAALARAEQIGFRDTEVNILCNLSDVHIRQGRYDDAAEFLYRGMGAARAMNDHIGEMSVLRDTGQLRLYQGRLDEAVDPLLKAHSNRWVSTMEPASPCPAWARSAAGRGRSTKPSSSWSRRWR